MRPEFACYILEHASVRASLLISTAAFSRDSWEDLRQELVLDYLRRSPKFDSSRGDWQSFVRGIMRNHSTILFTRMKRQARWEVLADDLVDRDGEIGNDSETIFGSRTHDDTNSLELGIDVRCVLGGLPPQLQMMAGMMVEAPMGEIPARMGKSRSRVYQMTRQIRDAFLRAGIGPTIVRS